MTEIFRSSQLFFTPSGSLKTVASDTLERLRRKSESVQGEETGPEALQVFTEAFEERLAIAEYDGCQTHEAAECMAYQDAFIQLLNALPDEGRVMKVGKDLWLHKRIQRALRTLVHLVPSPPTRH